MKRLLPAAAFALAATGCPAERLLPPPPPPPQPTDSPLDTRPTLGPMGLYRAPSPVRYQTDNGLTVWLVERHTQPVVSVTLALAVGSSQDPPGRGGLAYATANMLDEGAGDLDALGVAAAFEDRGARFGWAVTADGSRLQLTVLSPHFDGAFDAFGAVVSKPRFEPKEWERISKEWRADLLMRADDPDSVARVVTRAVLYGADTPYGAPADGQLDTAAAVSLADVKAFYESSWRPERAVLVVAGDIDRAALDAAIGRALGSWRRGRSAAAPATPPGPLAKRRHFVLVDRPESPQAVIAVVRPGAAASDPVFPKLGLVNTALGGSFTSRLNQNLREDKHWTYGAFSRFQETVGVGGFVAMAAVETAATAPALHEMLAEIEKMNQGGLADEEHRKVRAQDLADLIQTNESASGLASRLGSLAILGLPSDTDARNSEIRQKATLLELNELCKRYLSLDDATIVVVGPKEEVLGPLGLLELGDPEARGPDGRLLTGAAIRKPPAGTGP